MTSDMIWGKLYNCRASTFKCDERDAQSIKFFA